MPNFFARGDTVTPVKFSAVVFVAHLVFSVILMYPFGHVGIAIATTISAFVSLFQYVYGLKKRQLWSFSKQLLVTIEKIFLASVVMGILVYGVNFAFNMVLGNWLTLNILIKLFIFHAVQRH